MARLCFVLPILLVSCVSADPAPTDDPYEELLRRHRNKQWVTLSQDNVEQFIEQASRDSALLEEDSPDELPSPSTQTPTPPSEVAEDDDAEESWIDEIRTDSPQMEFRETPLKDVVRMVAKATGLDIFVPEALNQPITLSLGESQPLAALNAALKAHGHYLDREDSGLIMVRPISATRQDIKTRTFTLTSTPVDPVLRSLQDLLSPDGKLVVNPDGSSFIVLDTPEVISLMEEYVTILDVRDKQVIVEAKIVEVRIEDADEFGSLIELLDVSLDDTTSTITQDLLPINRALDITVASDKNALSGLLRMIATHRQVNLLSAPRVATMNGQAAEIEVIERIPYIDRTATTQTGTDGLGATTVQQVAFEEVGVNLSVTPSIGEDRMIKMMVEPQVRELTAFFEGVPVIDRRRVSTTVMVADGETLLIGGIIQEDIIHDHTKVPILGDLPLIGKLFRRTENRHEKTELVVAITPHILAPSTKPSSD